MGKSFSVIPVPEPPIIRKGASGSFYDKGLEGASHHAVIPNVNTVDDLRLVWVFLLGPDLMERPPLIAVGFRELGT